MSQIYTVLFIVYLGLFSLVLLSHLISSIWQVFLKKQLDNYGVSPHSSIAKYPFRHLGKPKVSIPQVVKFFLLSSFVAAFTGFLFVNSYEILTYTDIPMVNAIEKLPDEHIVKDMLTGSYIHNEGADELGRDRRLTVLKIPKIDSRIDLLTKIERNGDWLIRPNSGHYIFAGKDPNNSPEFLIIYLDSNWRTILNPLDLAIGDNLYIQKDNRQDDMFRIKSMDIVKFGDNYIPTESDKLQMILVVQDSSSKVNYIFQSEYINRSINQVDFLQSR